MIQAYKYTIYPTNQQKALLEKHFGCVRFIWNWALAEKTRTYQQTGKSVTRFDLQRQLPIMKKGEYVWLAEVTALSLQAELEILEKAFTGFFRNKKGYPNFKSKKETKCRFFIPQATKVDFKNSKVFIPKFREGVKAVLHRHFEGQVRTCTVSKTPTGKYYISILVETGKPLPEPKAISKNQTIAFDLGIKSFLVTSTGEKIDNPKYLAQAMKKLKRTQRWHSRKVKGSNNREKFRKTKFAVIHEKVVNQRLDFLHQTSSKYIKSEYTTFCFEKLNIKGMQKNRKLAGAVSDVGWGTFIQFMKYKAEWNGKNLLQIGRFDPSTKLCSHCGNLNQELTLKDREWTCKECGSWHDRDINAAKNIKTFALVKHNTVRQEVSEFTPVETV